MAHCPLAFLDETEHIRKAFTHLEYVIKPADNKA